MLSLIGFLQHATEHTHNRGSHAIDLLIDLHSHDLHRSTDLLIDLHSHDLHRSTDLIDLHSHAIDLLIACDAAHDYFSVFPINLSDNCLASY